MKFIYSSLAVRENSSALFLLFGLFVSLNLFIVFYFEIYNLWTNIWTLSPPSSEAGLIQRKISLIAVN